MLAIAGSDSGGGAGIQADLKAFARCGVHGMTAITALTAQNTVGVSAVEQVPPAMIIEQVRAVATDIGVDAAKIGMLGTAETVAAVVEALSLLGDAPIVVDPVMVAESGAVLLDDEARAALVAELLPLAAVATPNIPEARALSGAGEDADPERLAREVQALGPDAVVVTGGHGAGEMADLFFDGSEVVEHPGRRVPGRCGPRVGLHPFLCPRGPARPGPQPPGGGARSGRGRLGGCRARAALGRRRAGARRCRRPLARSSPRRRRRSAIIKAMRFVRMKPGHGDVLLAEGDIELAEDEERLIAEFRRQLDEGMWAAVPDQRPRRPSRGGDGSQLRGDPPRRRAGDLLPAGRRWFRAGAVLAPAEARQAAKPPQLVPCS